MPVSMPFLQEFNIGDKQIVADQLDFAAEFFGERLPVFPIAFGTAVLDAHDRVLAAEFDIEVDQFVSGNGFASALLEGVGAVVVVELRGGNIEGEEDLLAGLVARVFGGLENGFDGIFNAIEFGGETAFVADGGAEAALLRTDLRAWKISVIARRPSLKVGRPWGMIMNSWKSMGASEWAPPLMTLAIGTGSTLALGPPRYLKRGIPSASAAALALASETARMALAPSLDFVSVPSRSIMIRSTVNWSRASRPFEFGQDFFGDVLDGFGNAFA